MLNKQVLRIEKPLGYMLNEQVLRVKKPTNQALKNASLRVEKPTNQALKTQVHELNTPFFLTTSVPSTTQTAPKPLPLIRKHVSRQAHPLLRRAVVNRLLSPPFPLTSPPFGGAWGGFFVNFFPSSFPIYALLPSKRRPFAS